MKKSITRVNWLLCFVLVQVSAISAPKVNSLRVLSSRKGDVYCHCVMKLSNRQVPSNFEVWGVGNVSKRKKDILDIKIHSNYRKA